MTNKNITQDELRERLRNVLSSGDPEENWISMHQFCTIIDCFTGHEHRRARRLVADGILIPAKRKAPDLWGDLRVQKGFLVSPDWLNGTQAK